MNLSHFIKFLQFFKFFIILTIFEFFQIFKFFIVWWKNKKFWKNHKNWQKNIKNTKNWIKKNLKCDSFTKFSFFFRKKMKSANFFNFVQKKTKKRNFSAPPKIRAKTGFSSSARKNPGTNFPREKIAKSVKHGVPPVFALFCRFLTIFLGAKIKCHFNRLITEKIVIFDQKC